MVATLQIQYDSHSNEIFPIITFVYNYRLLLINFISPFHIAYRQNNSIVTNLRNQSLYKIFNDHVIITKNVNSKILFSLNSNFNKKFNVCHFKSIFWCIFKPGKTWNLLWLVNAIDQWNCLLHKNKNLFCSNSITDTAEQYSQSILL